MISQCLSDNYISLNLVNNCELSARVTPGSLQTGLSIVIFIGLKVFIIEGNLTVPVFLDINCLIPLRSHSYIKIYLAATLIIQSSLLFSEKTPVGLHSSSERFGGQVAETSRANQICWQTTKFSKLVFEINSSTLISLKGNQVVLASLSANKTIVIRKEKHNMKKKLLTVSILDEA